jgi:hypothetical protein
MTQFLCDHLLEAKSRAKDNELFVLIAPEPIDRQGIEMLERAIKSVVAARHRVIFVAPWLPDVNPSSLDPVAARIMAQTKLTNLEKQGLVEKQGQLPSGEFSSNGAAENSLSRSPISTSHPVDHDLRFGLTALGATYSRIGDPSLMQIVAMEIGLLQSGKSRAKSLRSR